MTRIAAGIRITAALLMLAAVGRLMLDGIQDGDFVPWNFFGFFTIQNNLLGAAALALSTSYASRERPRWVEYVRACAAVYLVIVVAVYWVLLAPTAEDDPSTWTNLVVHGVAGVAVLGDWLLSGPREPLPLSRLWVVLLYPAAWAAVTLTRGATDGWVPYPFLDPINGYAGVLTVVAGIFVAGLVVGAAVFPATRWRVLTPRVPALVPVRS